MYVIVHILFASKCCPEIHTKTFFRRTLFLCFITTCYDVVIWKVSCKTVAGCRTSVRDAGTTLSHRLILAGVGAASFSAVGQGTVRLAGAIVGVLSGWRDTGQCTLDQWTHLNARPDGRPISLHAPRLLADQPAGRPVSPGRRNESNLFWSAISLQMQDKTALLTNSCFSHTPLKWRF